MASMHTIANCSAPILGSPIPLLLAVFGAQYLGVSTRRFRSGMKLSLAEAVTRITAELDI